MRYYDNDEICAAVATVLTNRGVEAEAMQTGGNVWCVFVNEPLLPGTNWLFGTADVNWGGGLQFTESAECVGELDNDGRDMQLLDTIVSSDSENAREIATAILAALAAWREERRRFAVEMGQA